MRIFYPLLSYYPCESGGPANSVYWLNKALGNVGFTSQVLTYINSTALTNINHEELYYRFNIKVDYFGSSSFSAFYYKNLKLLISCNVIHFSSLFFFPTLFYLIFGLFFRKKIVLSPRGELYQSALRRHRFRKELYLKIIKLLQKRIIFHATNFEEAELIMSFFVKCKKVVIIPNFIQLPVYRKDKTLNNILFLGRINPIKNIHIIIEAFSAILNEIDNSFNLVIAGDAKLDYEKEYLLMLTSLVSELGLNNRVTFYGGVYGPEKEQLLADSYCLVLISESENFGNVVLEAMSQGTPVIASKNSPWSIVEEKGAGYWIESNVSSLSSSLLDIVNLDIYDYRMKCTKSLEIATMNFDINKNIDLWLKLYSNDL